MAMRTQDRPEEKEGAILHPPANVPSMIITSQNAVKTASLVTQIQNPPHTQYYTATFGQGGPHRVLHSQLGQGVVSDFKTRGKVRVVPVESEAVEKQHSAGRPTLGRQASLKLPETQGNFSESIRRSEPESVCRERPQRRRQLASTQDIPLMQMPQDDFPTEVAECNVKSSANMRMIIEPQSCVPTINININNLNINSRNACEPYGSFDHSHMLAARRTPSAGNRVSASISRAGNFRTSQQLSASPRKSAIPRTQANPGTRLHCHLDPTLAEVLLGGVAPYDSHLFVFPVC